MNNPNDKELADRVVALGVGICVDDVWYGLRDRPDGSQPMGTKIPKKFVRDWRVAGALMEKFNLGYLSEILGVAEFWTTEANPRTIIEVCVEEFERV
ncbi:hypothetical protein LCGC14_2393030 [marine sediment metagenome]|uniref:Uncharacterized protein n=1 Tax=marine sediment metagenome TaxID=412755 RepID=A0A0F9BXP4_9ZZZZ